MSHIQFMKYMSGMGEHMVHILINLNLDMFYLDMKVQEHIAFLINTVIHKKGSLSLKCNLHKGIYRVNRIPMSYKSDQGMSLNSFVSGVNRVQYMIHIGSQYLCRFDKGDGKVHIS